MSGYKSAAHVAQTLRALSEIFSSKHRKARIRRYVYRHPTSGAHPRIIREWAEQQARREGTRIWSRGGHVNV